MAHRFNILVFLIFLSFTLSASQQDDYARIISAYENNDFVTVDTLCNSFIASYPRSNLLPDVMLLQAEIEPDPQKAVVSLKKILSQYPNFKQADYCRYKICETLYFTSKWDELEDESSQAISIHGARSRYYPDFVFFSSKAHFYTHNFDESLYAAGSLIRDYKRFSRYPEVRLQTIYASQKVSYDASDYALSLKKSYFELKGTGSDISALYLLGRHYEYTHKYDYSFSLYSDIIQKYPRSPEALLSKKRIEIIRSQNPKYIQNVLEQIKTEPDSIVSSLSPTRDVEERNMRNYYALTIGPLYNLQEAEKLAGELRRTFTNVHIVRKYRNFVIYVGRESSSSDTMGLKIRLAEEYAINANIVYVTNHNGLNFVHGE